MDINMLCQDIRNDLDSELQLIDQDMLPRHRKYQLRMQAIAKYMNLLLSDLDGYTFNTPEEEIHFFKKVKPELNSYRFFFEKRQALDADLLFSEQEERHERHKNERVSVHRFFRQHAFLFQYYTSGASELDHIYFLRSHNSNDGALALGPGVGEYRTQGEALFGQFIACERYYAFLLKKSAETSGGKYGGKDDIHGAPLKWTGEKNNLVEIIYGMYYTGQLNNGNAKVADIIRWMEEQLGVDLSRAYRSFIDIRNRKRDSQTRFLDKMRDSIHLRVEEDQAFRPIRSSRRNDKP